MSLNWIPYFQSSVVSENDLEARASMLRELCGADYVTRIADWFIVGYATDVTARPPHMMLTQEQLQVLERVRACVDEFRDALDSGFEQAWLDRRAQRLRYRRRPRPRHPRRAAGPRREAPRRTGHPMRLRARPGPVNRRA